MSTKENQLRKYIECKEKHKQKMKSQFSKLYQEYQKISDKKSCNLLSSMVSKNNLQFFLERYSKSNSNIIKIKIIILLLIHPFNFHFGHF